MQAAQDGPRRRGRNGVLIAVVIGAVIAVSSGGVASWRQSTYDRNIQRLPGALPAPTASRPVANPGQNWLLIGSDQRKSSDPARWQHGESHADTIMLLHLPEAGNRAYIISIPRDSWVEVPGHGMSKINGAFALGGPRLLTETVEQLTDIRVDHVAAIDFRGFKQMTDALGGVEVVLKSAIVDPSNAWSWPAGRNTLDGDEALRFVRERKGLPGSDLDRVKRQQAFIKAMADKAASTGTVTNPLKLDAFLRATSEAVAIDETADFGTLRGLAFRLAEVGPDRITFVSVPVGETAWIGPQNVVLLDRTGSEGLFAAVRNDRLTDYVRSHNLDNDVTEVR
jgi:LCP family protein required for cell wall assembly